MKRRERRRHPRVEAAIEVSFATAAAYVIEYTKNISKGGIFVKTDNLPDPNAVVELRLKFPGSEQEVSILSKVARMVTTSDPDREGEHVHGVGFYFIEWSSQARKRFDAFYTTCCGQGE